MTEQWQWKKQHSNKPSRWALVKMRTQFQYERENTNRGLCGFICNANSLFCPSSFIAYLTTLYWQCALHTDVAVSVCVCRGLFACLLFTLLFLADRDCGTTLTPVRMTEREQVRGKNWAICLQHSAGTETERATPNTHTTNRLAPPPLPATKVRENTMKQ